MDRQLHRPTLPIAQLLPALLSYAVDNNAGRPISPSWPVLTGFWLFEDIDKGHHGGSVTKYLTPMVALIILDSGNISMLKPYII